MTLETFSSAHCALAAEIERLCFSEPWTGAGLSMFTREGGMGVACLEGGRLAAYACMTYVLDEGEIVTVATHPDFRRRGLARRTLARLCEDAAARGILTLTLEVRESNAPARALYAAESFREVGRRRGFYALPREDAIVMQKTLGDQPAITDRG